MPDGYSYEPAALDSIASQLKAAASSLDSATQGKVPDVDAGKSTNTVGARISVVHSAGIALAQFLDDSGHAVEVGHGNYADIENTNAGEFAATERISALTEANRQQDSGLLDTRVYDEEKRTDARSWENR
ncbi:hypothetical protein [Actinophytocola sp. NPDC049390]|uniref:hypothetical protein n=1 Tax=Actinophytocola sp. NPDC049390 TaxID=3363894 RepID=UPI0037887753